MNKASRKPNDPREYCRNCDHCDAYHNRAYYYACGREPRTGEWLGEVCECQEFVPEDNLEYLEYVLNKKEQL